MINKVGNKNFIIPQRKMLSKAPSKVYSKMQSEVAFKGKLNPISFIENNPVLALYVVDFLGMQAPRIAIDTLRNKEELGHLNYNAGRETALREFSTASLMYLSPAFIALGLGKLVAKHQAKKYGVDSKEFIGNQFLQIAKNKLKQTKGANALELKQNFVEKILDSMESYGTQKRPLLSPEEKKQVIDEILKVDKSNKKGIENIAEKLKVKNEIRYTIKYGRKSKLDGTIKSLVTDIVKFRDGFIDKNIKKAEKFNPKKLFKDVSELCKNTIKFNKTKSIVGFTTALGLLIVFPKVNIWITKKISGDKLGKFPGLQGLDKESNQFDRLEYLQEVRNANKK